MVPPIAQLGISLRGIVKTYGSTVALAGLDLDFVPGQILGIAGPNGAGKSTLVRVVAGEEKPTKGEMFFDGRPWSPVTEWQAVAVVHQEPQLFPNLTVAENMMVGREGTGRAKPRLGPADAAVMEKLGILHLQSRLLEDCSLATQQRTEIARAVARDCRVFLFDEPNSALTSEESNELFRLMHELAGQGHIVVLITHRLADLVAHCGRVVVIRDGVVRATLPREGLTEETIARQLVTESVVTTIERAAPAANATAAPTLRLRNWTHREGAFTNVSLEAKACEIVALIGVEGSGARELLRSIGGVEKATGEIAIGTITGDAVIDHAQAYVPATRQLSLYSNFSVGENLLVRLGPPEIATRGAGFLKSGRMREIAASGIKRFLVKAQSQDQPIRSLSGGNQQKVAIAQALQRAPQLLVLEEPTRGVDIHSKAEIYRLLRDYANSGNVVVIYCTEVLEAFEAADRVYVVADGALMVPITVSDHGKVDELAATIARLEQKGRAAA
jgi:ABC-type sugar transport system ATPase subunit